MLKSKESTFLQVDSWFYLPNLEKADVQIFQGFDCVKLWLGYCVSFEFETAPPPVKMTCFGKIFSHFHVVVLIYLSPL